MICKECGKKFTKEGNIAVRTNGVKITVCPNCGQEEVEKKVMK